jgi:UDP-N-acetylglucosamine 1-carboxyvinyltransferase
MESFIVDGGHPLKGEIKPAGNKNAALPIMAACLLTDQEVHLTNVPAIRDVETMLTLMEDLGVSIRRLGNNELILQAKDIAKTDIRHDLASKIRGSLLLAGPLLARCGRVTMPRPGGDLIGRRRVDTHLLALESLGAECDVNHVRYIMHSRGRLEGVDLFLDEMSVTATENAIIAAATARGTTIIRNAASEPHVQDLISFMKVLGAKIEGSGTNVLTIHGVDSLAGGQYSIQTDHTEVGSLIALAAVTRSEITIKDAVPEHLRMTLMAFRRLGVQVEIRGNDIFVPRHDELGVVFDTHGAIPKIDDGPWPAFPTDMISVAIVLATQAQGTVLIWEKMYEGRMFFVDKLMAMGARLVLCDPYRVVVVGPSALHGEEMTSPDIRAGVALLIAALCAGGTSVIRNVGQIDRGYEQIEQRLCALGAHIERVTD